MTKSESLNVWSGIFRTFSEAAAENTIFHDQIWLSKIRQRAERALAQMRVESAIPPAAFSRDYALPSVAALAAHPGEPLRILDFGGGLGASFPSLISMLPADQPVDFIVIENEAVCELGRDVFRGDPRIRFETEPPLPSQTVDIVHFGSSLHYVDDWLGLVERLLKLRPQYMLFADLPASDNATFVTAQNFHGRRIPVHFWNVTEFIAALEKLGARLLLKSRYYGYYRTTDSEIDLKNFPPQNRLRYFSQLVFRTSIAATDRK